MQIYGLLKLIIIKPFSINQKIGRKRIEEVEMFTHLLLGQMNRIYFYENIETVKIVVDLDKDFSV